MTTHNDAAPPPSQPPAIRLLKCSMTPEEFGLVSWCALRTKRDGKTIPLAEFFRQAVFAKCVEVVRGEIDRGKAIPPGIAHLLDEVRPGRF